MLLTVTHNSSLEHEICLPHHYSLCEDVPVPSFEPLGSPPETSCPTSDLGLVVYTFHPPTSLKPTKVPSWSYSKTFWPTLDTLGHSLQDHYKVPKLGLVDLPTSTVVDFNLSDIRPVQHPSPSSPPV